MRSIDIIMRSAPVIPVIVIDDAKFARPIAEVLVACGLPALEVTLRTPSALNAIAEMKKVAGAIVGAGTVTNRERLHDAINAGAEFIVSPGLTPKLGEAAIESGIPFLPGVANAADIMRGLEFGLNYFKFFPAMASGGLPALKAFAAVFGQCGFCPTGGITPANAPEWLALEAVPCVGGTWLVPPGKPAIELIRAAAQATKSFQAN